MSHVTVSVVTIHTLHRTYKLFTVLRFAKWHKTPMCGSLEGKEGCIFGRSTKTSIAFSVQNMLLRVYENKTPNKIFGLYTASNGIPEIRKGKIQEASEID